MASCQRPILIADDEPHIVQVLCIMLEDVGYEVIVARHGREALAATVKHQPAGIICDLNMPAPSGLELARQLMHYPASAELPIILLTGHGLKLKPQQLEKTNIVHVLSKPFSPHELRTLLAELVGEPADLALPSVEESAHAR